MNTKQLKMCVYETLTMARFLNAASVSLPAISTGSNGQFPVNQACDILLRSCLKWASQQASSCPVKLIRLIDETFGQDLIAALARVRSLQIRIQQHERAAKEQMTAQPDEAAENM